MLSVKLRSIRSSWKVKCPVFSCSTSITLAQSPANDVTLCSDTLARSSSSCVPAVVAPCGSNKGSRVGASVHHTSVPTQGEWGWWGGGETGECSEGSHWPGCADGFQPWHVTRISRVVTLTSSLLSPSHAAHMPSIPRGDVLHDNWEGYLPSCTELSLTHSPLMLFQVNVNVTLLTIRPVQLSSAKFLPRGHVV